jgi:NADH-quinone oxidoreductase subunit C
MLPELFQQLAAASALESWDPEAIEDAKFECGQPILYIAPSRIAGACRFLKEQFDFARLSAVTAVDWYPREPRFEVVYQLHSLIRKRRLRLKCRLPGDFPELDSVTSVWRSADWYEREVFDLFGVVFRGHPNLNRILMPEDWQGHPLRKDYPIHGYKYSYAEES